MEETLLCYKDNEIFYCKIVKDFSEQKEMPQIYEFEDVVEYLNTVNDEPFTPFSVLEDVRNFYLNGRRQIDAYLYQDHTWFYGIFNDHTIEFRKETAEEELSFDSPIADFFGWKISKKSKFARNSEVQIFKNSLKISEEIIDRLKRTELIETTNTWGKSVANPLIHLIISDFNKKTSGLAIASYFEIWFWNKENEIFESFDPEVPARGDNFNPKECLVFEEKFVFVFFKPAYVDKNWNVFEATIESEYQDVTSIGEPYDSAFYTVTSLNNLIDYLKDNEFDPKLYIQKC